MLDPKITDMARERIEVAIDERWSPLARETSEIKSRMISRGVFRSSMTANEFLELYRNELDIQASMAWGQLKTVLMTVGVRDLSEFGTDLKSFIEEMINWLTADLMKRLEEVFRPFEKMSRGAANPQDHLEKAKTHAIRKIYTEIDLFEAALTQKGQAAEDPGGTHVTISGGQVGILQTGAFSTASMVVRLDSTSKQEIAKALGAVEKALEEAAHVPFDRAEISEMIRESKSELGKPRPNVPLLRSLMQGVATSIQTVASLRPAYDAIKGGLALVGVTLP
jgi:hypothetical protein